MTRTKINRVYMDAKDKNVATVLVFVNDNDELFYDKEFTVAVPEEDIKELYFKGSIFVKNERYYTPYNYDPTNNTIAWKPAESGSGLEEQEQADWNEDDGTKVSYIKNKPEFATVATSGSYNDLDDIPVFANVATSGSYDDLTDKPEFATVASTGNYTDLNGIPALSTIATSGNYNDLSNKPDIPAAQIPADWNQGNHLAPDYIKNKPTIPEAYTLPTASTETLGGVKVDGTTITIDNNGVISGNSIEQVPVDWEEEDSSSLAYIANKPTIPDAQIPSDWNQSDSTALDYIKNKPSIPAAQVQVDWNQGNHAAIDYIKNKPTIPAAQIPADWEQDDSTALDYIKNKPTIPEAQVPADWNEDDSSSPAYILNKPTIPAAPVNPNWNETDSSSLAYIQNKPTIPAAQEQVDWSEGNHNSIKYIKNKPTLGTASAKDFTASVTENSADLVTSGAVYSAINAIPEYTLPTSSTETLGGVKVDGTSITINEGVISSTQYSLPTASNETLGGVKVDGDTITIDNGVISANIPEIPEQEQADWNEDDTTSVSYIQNKPTIPDISPINANLLSDTEVSNENGLVTIDANGSNLTSCTTTLAPIQDLHGYDYPWVGGAGKNIFDESDYSGDDYSYSNGTFSNTNVDTKTVFDLYIRGYKANSTYDVLGNFVIRNTGKISIIFTSSNDYVKFGIVHNGSQRNLNVYFDNISLSAGQQYTFSFNVLGYNPSTVGGLSFKEIQVETGASATSYAPYSNICPISGYDSVSLTILDDSTKKQYFDGLLNGTYGFVNLGTLTWTLLGVGESTFYASIVSTNNYYGLCSRYTNIGLQSYGEMVDKTIQVRSDYIYIKDTMYTDATTFKNALSDVYLIYELATPTTPTITSEQYETLAKAFNGQAVMLEFDNTIYSGVIDWCTGVVTVDKGMGVINENSNITDNGALSTIAHEFAFAGLTDKKVGLSNFICDRLEVINNLGLLKAYTVIGRANTSTVAIRLPIDIDTVEKAKTWLSTNNLQIVYELVTPQTITLTPSQLTTLKGTNTISTPQGAISLTYQPDNVIGELKKSIDDVEREIPSVDSAMSLTSVNPLQNKVIASELQGVVEASTEGQVLTLSNCAGIFADSVSVSIEPVQDLHGYSYPWVGGAGVNIWDEQWESGVYTIAIGSTISKSNNANYIRAKNIISVVEGATYFFKLKTQYDTIIWADDNDIVLRVNGVRSDTFSYAGTPPQNAKYVVFYSYGTTYNNDICINVSNSTINGNYYPYSNICPITGYDDVSVTRTGVNQWDEQVKLGYYDSTGAYQSANNRLCTKNKIKVNPQNIYYCKLPLSSSLTDNFIICYDKNEVFLQRLNISNDGNGFSFTTPNNCYYININFSTSYTGGTTYNHDISINYPSTITTYQSYQGHAITATIGDVEGGFNIWDEVTESGDINTISGETQTASNVLRSKNYSAVNPNTTYYLGDNISKIYYYDNEKNYISYEYNIATGNVRTTPSNAKFIKIVIKSDYGTTYNNDICINISNPLLNGLYASYGQPAPYTMYSGSVGFTTGVVTVDKKCVDMSTLTWSYSSANAFFYTSTILDIKQVGIYGDENIVSSQYKWHGVGGSQLANGEMMLNSKILHVKDTRYTDVTTFTTAMDGAQLVYELATPQTIQLTPQQLQMLKGYNAVTTDANGGMTVRYQPNNVVGECKEYAQNAVSDGLNSYIPATVFDNKMVLFMGDSFMEGFGQKAADGLDSTSNPINTPANADASPMRGWAKTFAERYPRANVHNLGIYGATIAYQDNNPSFMGELVYMFNNNWQPDYVVFDGGANDIFQGITSGSATADDAYAVMNWDTFNYNTYQTIPCLEAIFSLFNSNSPTTRLLFIIPPEMSLNVTTEMKTNIDNMQTTIENVCAKWGVSTLRLTEKGSKNTIYSNNTDYYSASDKIHPKQRYYDETINRIISALEAM